MPFGAKNYQISTINCQLSTIMRPWLNIQLITAFVLSVGGLVMLFCGIYISPLGQIHESLLVAFGEVATFAGSLMGIDYHYKAKNNENNNTNPAKERG